MEASALTYAGRRGLLARRSPLLRLQGDERLVALLRRGNDHAFEAIVDRYQARLLGFCRQMLGSTEDAEDVLQEVFVNAYRAMLADNREIKLRPWLYRIARNRCLNHLRKPVAEAQESMDMHPATEAAATHERVQNREEFRQLLCDVGKLPETQRSALLLREMDAMSYEDIAEAMETTVPSVKSLLVRARIALAEASQSRLLTCGEVRVELAEAAEGLAKASGPVRRHVRECDGCRDFRIQLRSDSKVMAALFPIGPLLLLKGLLLSKLGLGGAGASGGASAAGASGAGASGAALGGAGGAAGGISGAGAIGSAIGAKAVASVVTAAVITAGAVEVKRSVSTPVPEPTTTTTVTEVPAATTQLAPVQRHHASPAKHAKAEPKQDPAPAPAADPVAEPTASEELASGTGAGDGDHNGDNDQAGASTTPASTVSVVVTEESTSTTTVTTSDPSPPPPPPPTTSPPQGAPPPPPADDPLALLEYPPPPSGS